MPTMDFSTDWKSLFPISEVFIPPLLLSGPSTKPILGPLLFNPVNQTRTLLLSSPSLLPGSLPPPPQLSLPRFLVTSSSVPPSTASSLGSLLGPASYDAASHLLHNHLSFLQLPGSNSVLVFFPTGANSEQVGFLGLSVNGSGSGFDVQVNKNGDVFWERTGFEYRIHRISVNPTVCPSAIPPGKSRSFVSIGYVMASTMYSVHWFIVKVKGLGLSQDSPALVCLGSKLFKSCSVVWACWSPHLPEESLVLLENGALFLFDLESCLRSDTTNAHLSGTRLPIPWDDDSGTSRDCKWIACEFSWHPRILVVLRSDAVFLVDLRSDECVVTCLAKVEMLRLYAKFEKERFLTFTVVDSDRFCFALASDSLLLLCDVRKPMVPVLQWGHGLDKPCYIEVFRLSELRSNSRDDAFSWASESGFCIMLGSFWNCEFNLFCYGPTLPADKGSMASEVAELSKSVYAWELPSDLILSGRNCRCGSCLIREEALKEDLPEWIEWQQKKEIVLGFGILNKVVSSQLCRSDEFGGFTVMRLMSSGKLELQRYRASWHTVKKMKEFHRELLHFEDNFLYIPDEEEYRFPRRFKYVKLDNLSAYLNGNLGEVLVSKMKKPLDNRLEKYSFTPESHEILCEKLKACGLGRLRSSPAVSAVFNDISSPASIHEVGLRRLWSGLPIELLQLAYSNYSEFLEVLLDQKKVALEFLVVPDLPQLPPFFLRKPSCRSNKWSQKVQRSEALVGPVLPLPVLLTIHDYRNGSSYLQEGEFSLERELSLRYEEVKQVASELAVPDSSCELHDDKAVSLGDDQDDAWGASQKQKPFCLFHPAALKRNDFKDKKFDILIFKVAEKKQAETAGLELFDDLSSTQLRFDASAKNFQPSELKAFSAMKRQWSKWQDGFDSYQEFCTSSKHHKQVAGAAAAAGLSLAEVAVEAKRVSEMVGTVGVVLSVCTLPGQATLDRLCPEKMELGLGIETNYVPITRGNRVELMVTGLGATPVMELMIASGKAVPKLQLEHL